MRATLVSEDIYEGITDMLVCCETVSSNEGCERCPLYSDDEEITSKCLEWGSLNNIARKITKAEVNRLLQLADEYTDIEEERNKTDFDRKWEYEADYWNDRFCDPD